MWNIHEALSILAPMNPPARPRTKTRLRYDATSAYARGTETRERLVAAGLALFGERGFDAASTRDIAAAAGLNAPSLQYYFNNKEGLYLACLRHVVVRIWDGVSVPVMAAERTLRAAASDAALIEAFCAIQVSLLEISRGADENWFLLVAREQAGLGPPAGFEVMHRGMRRMKQVQTGIIGRLSGLAGNARECLLREMSLNGQVLYFGMMRRSALHSLRERRFEAHTLETLERVIRGQSSAALRALSVARRRRSPARHESDRR